MTVNADGTFSITLPVGLSRQSGNDNPAPDVNPARHPRTGKSKPSMSLLGLGHFIWQQAEINTWKPQYVKNRPRNALWLASRINTTAQSIRISKMTLSDVLLVSAANEGAQKLVNQQRVRFATENKKRMVVISAAESRFRRRLYRNAKGASAPLQSARFSKSARIT